MDRKQFDMLLQKLEKITNLLVLIASKSGAKSEEIGKVLGVAPGRPRQILAGVSGKKKRESHGKKKS